MTIETADKMVACDVCGRRIGPMSEAEANALVTEAHWLVEGAELMCGLCRACAGDFGEEAKRNALEIRAATGRGA